MTELEVFKFTWLEFIELPVTEVQDGTERQISPWRIDTHVFMTPKPTSFVLVHTFCKNVYIIAYYLHADILLSGEGKIWWHLGQH